MTDANLILSPLGGRTLSDERRARPKRRARRQGVNEAARPGVKRDRVLVGQNRSWSRRKSPACFFSDVSCTAVIDNVWLCVGLALDVHRRHGRPPP